MNESNIRKYAGLMKELDLTGLEIKEDNCVVRLERTGVFAPASKPEQLPEVSLKEKTEPTNYISVRSPMIGVFYTSPAENADSFVSVGDSVKKGSTLCMIEAMKLMNEITAEQDGTVLEICAKNGQVVDYGCELFRIGGE